jgi:hypothetical protein
MNTLGNTPCMLVIVSKNLSAGLRLLLLLLLGSWRRQVLIMMVGQKHSRRGVAAAVPPVLGSQIGRTCLCCS